MNGPAANRRAAASAALRGLLVLVLAAGAALWAQQLSKEYIHAGERLLAVKVPGTGVTPGALTATLAADRFLITAGESATLTWTTTGASSARLDPGGETIAAAELASGSKSVSPTTTTTYTLTASGETGSVTVMPGITATLAADPFQLTAGQSTTLRWTTSGASSATLDPGGETIAAAELASGSKTVSPSATTAYTLTATGTAGAASATANVTVGGSSPVSPPTATLVADPTTITSGGSAMLRWTTTNASSATLDPGGETIAAAELASGSKTVSPTTTTTYTLTATNTAGSTTATATVTVGGGSSCPVIDSFSASPTSIKSGGSARLEWTTTGATAVSIPGTSGTLAVDGSTSVSPTRTTTYTLTASRTGCTTATATVTVTVTTTSTPPSSDPNEPTATLSANPATITAGESARLTWATTDAVSAAIDPALGIVMPPAAGEVVRMHMTANGSATFGHDLYYEGQSTQPPLEDDSDDVIEDLRESVFRIAWDPPCLGCSNMFYVGVTDTNGGAANNYWGTGLTGASKSIFIYDHTSGATPGIAIAFSDFDAANARYARFSITDTTRRQYLDSIWGGERWTMIIANPGAVSLNAPPPAGGSVSVSPSETTTYTLKARGPGGIATATSTVTVNAGSP